MRRKLRRLGKQLKQAKEEEKIGLAELWKLIEVTWMRGKVAQQWRQEEGVFLWRKTKGAIEQFRVISLLSVEGKVLF